MKFFPCGSTPPSSSEEQTFGWDYVIKNEGIYRFAHSSGKLRFITLAHHFSKARMTFYYEPSGCSLEPAIDRTGEQFIKVDEKLYLSIK